MARPHQPPGARSSCPCAAPAHPGSTLGWALLVALLLAGPAPAGAAERPPNILLVVADDLGGADLACYGADLHETPHLDRLARDGVRFTQAYAAAPICSPTRAALLTGKYPARLHMTIWYEGALRPVRNRVLIPPQTVADLPHAEMTLAEALQAAGYRTAHVGKWHLGGASHYPETQGFDVNVGGTHWGAPQTFFHPFRGTRHFGGEFRYVPGLGFGAPGEYLTDRLTDEALKLIDAAGEQPFYLNLWYHAVHTPIEGKPALVEHYRQRLRPGLHHQNPAYAAMVHTLDANVGRLLRKLDERQLTQRTLVVFTSDNGGYINAFEGKPVTNNAPLRSGKGSLYEGGIRVPLLVRWPGVTPAGATCAEPVVSMDLFATLLEASGRTVDRATGQDGLSLLPLLRNPGARLGRDALYFHYPHYYATTTPVSAVRAGDWKLLEYHEDDRTELYNLAWDGSETTDLAAHEGERRQKMRERLHAWRRAIAAQMPTRNPDRRARPVP